MPNASVNEQPSEPTGLDGASVGYSLDEERSDSSAFVVSRRALDLHLTLAEEEGRIAAGQGFRLFDLLPKWVELDLPEGPVWEIASVVYLSGVQHPLLLDRPDDVPAHGLAGAATWLFPRALTLLLSVGDGPILAGSPIDVDELLPDPSHGFCRCRATTLRLLEAVATSASALLPAARAAAAPQLPLERIYKAAYGQLWALAEAEDLPECRSRAEQIEAWRDQWKMSPAPEGKPGDDQAEAESSLAHDLALGFLALAPDLEPFRSSLRWAASAVAEASGTRETSRC